VHQPLDRSGALGQKVEDNTVGVLPFDAVPANLLGVERLAVFIQRVELRA
jgi:hypothetical protein